MTHTNKPNNEQRKWLMRQQRTEWNLLLDLETTTRLALYARQEQESRLEQESTINIHQRAELTRHHQEQREALRRQERQNRITTLKRHAQQASAL